MKKYLFALASLFLFGSCRTLNVQDYHRQSPLKEPIPALALKVHAESFAARFAGEVMEDFALGSAGPRSSWVPSPFEVYTRVGASMQDVFTLLGNELKDNIIAQAAGQQYGQARFKLVYFNSTMPGWGWILPSVLTFNIANLAGMPYTRYRADLELQMEILDANQQVIAQYQAPGSGKATVALYYGYGGSDAYRKANLLALQQAMEGIRAKMEPDLAKLHNDLLAGNPEKK